MDGDRQRSAWLVEAPASGPPDDEAADDRPGRRLLVVGVLVVGLFVGGGTLLGNYLGRHSGAPPQATPAAPGTSAQQAPPPPSSLPPSQSTEPARQDRVTYEAEDPANTVSGGAFVATYAGASGGRIVKNIGAWGSPSGTGRLTFTGVRVAAARQYDMKLFYVHVNGDATRTLLVSVNGAAPIRVSVSGGSVCCRSQAVTVRLKAGVNRITLSNPTGHAPAIDKITVTRV